MCGGAFASVKMEVWMRRDEFAIVTRCRRSDADRAGDVEVRSSGDALQALPQKRYGVLEMRCRRCLFVSRALAYCLLLLEFLAFVPQQSRGKTLARQLYPLHGQYPASFGYPPLTLAPWPPEVLLNNCGHSANDSGRCFGANSLR